MSSLNNLSELYQAMGESTKAELIIREALRSKIRAQLLESAERTHQVALADVQKFKGWEGRERLRQAAEKTYAGSLSRIDELTASFAEIVGTAKASQITNEMTHILAEVGVDEALTYVATKRADILEEVQGRKAVTSDENRVDLLPLLKSAQLQADRNQLAEADSLFADVLALEPDWPDARNAFACFLIQQSMTVESAMGNSKLKRAAEICKGTLALDPREKSPESWASAQNDLGSALQELGTRTSGVEGRELLKDSAVAYRSALEVILRPIGPKTGPLLRTISETRLGNSGTSGGKRSSCSKTQWPLIAQLSIFLPRPIYLRIGLGLRRIWASRLGFLAINWKERSP